ncbi:hypothetical protein [Neisseria sp. Ec49-e6-T10]|uniref:hypothetical protein n=1 Tax=Neisseria sp. Ec49-e6-T10 TaxID=3140744 RepID=UPI003EBD39EA
MKNFIYLCSLFLCTPAIAASYYQTLNDCVVRQITPQEKAVVFKVGVLEAIGPQMDQRQLSKIKATDSTTKDLEGIVYKLLMRCENEAKNVLLYEKEADMGKLGENLMYSIFLEIATNPNLESLFKK